MTVDTCKCTHTKQAHEVAGLAPQCTAPRCECIGYRPTTAPAAVARPVPAPAGLTTTTTAPVSITVTATGPTAEQLIAAGKRSSLKRVVAMAEKIETELAALAERLRAERQATEAARKRAEEQEAARREIRRLEKQLADAKARLKTTRHELGLPGGERPTDGVNQCPDCPETFDTAQRLGVHRRWKHNYRKPSS
jgi:hypothetical protein